MSPRPESSKWIEPYGLVAKRSLPANAVVYSRMLGTVKPAIVIKRNQSVLIKIDKPWIFVTASGKAKQDGRVGDYIKVQNIDSQRIIVAKVKEDGSVEPVF